MTSMDTAPHPIIVRPQVLLSNAGGRRVARCTHCDWKYADTVKTDVESQARYHRGQHRAGQTAVTR